MKAALSAMLSDAVCANTLPNVASQVEIPCVRIRAMNFLIAASVARQEHDELLFSRFELSDRVGCSLRATNRRRVFVRCGVLRIEIAALVCTMTKLAKGEVLGVREEGISLRDKRYWKAVASTLAPDWGVRSRGILNALLVVFGGRRLSTLRQEEVERWYAERRGQVKASTANKELARLKRLLVAPSRGGT